MKKIILLLFVFTNTAFYGQDLEKITLSKDGFLPNNIIIKTDSLSSDKIYTRCMNWVKRNYNSPDVVIKSTIENEMIRIEGGQVASSIKNGFGTDFPIYLYYTMSIDIKNGKCKIELYNYKSTYNSHVDIFNKKGLTRTEKGELIKNDLESSMNKLINSLNSEINNLNKSDW